MENNLREKRKDGRYYTSGNPFDNLPFRKWAIQIDLQNSQILEPFAGSNRLIKLLLAMGFCSNAVSYDIMPANNKVKQRDTLKEFPIGYDICITNPPWLAKNSASVRGLAYPDCQYDDLYKYALDKCLSNCAYIAALVPESFITANLFQDRLQSFVSLTDKMFMDTGHPVGLALFGPNPICDVDIWSGIKHIGLFSLMKKHKPKPQREGVSIKFNDPDGNVGLIALDNTKEASIRFCDVEELANYKVKTTSRHITKLSVDGKICINEWNLLINEFRNKTQDILMTSYRGIRKDGKYRRRCDWDLARGIIHHVK